MRQIWNKAFVVLLLSFLLIAPFYTIASVTKNSVTPQDDKIGVLLIGFGEPERYDANTEVAWKNFLGNYMESGMRMFKMSFMYPIVSGVMIPMMDSGTLLVDRDDPSSSVKKVNPILIDAWGNPYEGKDYRWVSIAEGEFPMLGPLFSYYLAPDGPGKGESDFWEYVGLSMYDIYQKMDDYNPGEERELKMMDEVEAKLKERYGDEIIIERGFGAARPGFPDFRVAAESLAREGVKDIVLAEDYVVFSDFEHPAGEIPEYLEEKGLNVNIVTSGQIGGTDAYNRGVAKKVEEELKDIPNDRDVVVILNHHGMFNVNMILYDWRDEPYHEYAKETFEGAEKAIYDLNIVKNWNGKIDVWQAYTEFSEGMMDPDKEILSVREAADKASKENYEHCIDVPYEVGNSGYETLFGLREEGWGLESPAWEEYYEDDLRKYRTEFEYDGMNVIITDGWIDGYAEGYYEEISRAIDGIHNGGE
ncbi:MAG: hypothetical protein EF807_04295 [Candidatus Methanolliviera hydrocarbonicum]|uniref:Uncharacterized protein n=1 Tax=Candidatus Methanolliviera hydrocarbonicum TaxID=2491085 RepID=A0A520KXX6_9EURY|nr:MAG: hypothetical protein EF807_04295 [Candidatus Methanolliviera hydrocarbonicum]